jgi:hypothetical protein
LARLRHTTALNIGLHLLAAFTSIMADRTGVARNEGESNDVLSDATNHSFNEVREPGAFNLEPMSSLNHQFEAPWPQSTQITLSFDRTQTNEANSSWAKKRQVENVPNCANSSDHSLSAQRNQQQKRRTSRSSRKQTEMLESWLSDNILQTAKIQ